MTLLLTIFLYLFITISYRVAITKMALNQFSIQPPSKFNLYKTYTLVSILVFVIIVIPLIVLQIVLSLSDTAIGQANLQYFHIKELLILQNILIPFIYILEMLLIKQLLKKATNNEITYKIVLILTIVFFLLDSLFHELVFYVQDIYNQGVS